MTLLKMLTGTVAIALTLAGCSDNKPSETPTDQVVIDVTIAGDGLSFTAVYSGDTGSWGIGTARWDIKFLQGTTVFYSDTMRLDVIGQVTV